MTRSRICRLAAERHFDVVHACNPARPAVARRTAAASAGTRFIFDHHDLVPELYRTRFGDRHRAMHALTLAAERLAFSLADVVISANESYRAVALSRGRRRPEDVFVVRNGPDLDRLHLVEPDPP